MSVRTLRVGASSWVVTITQEMLAQHHVFVPSDNEWQREARLRQALWRELQGLPIGEHRGRPLGSRLGMPFAEQTLANYLTDGIRSVVQSEVRASEKLYRAPRIYDDLLSSQPLCFNLFAELSLDLELASRVFVRLLGKELRVTAMEFEHSPGRHDPRFTNDGSAFDVFVAYQEGGANRFLGIEVKYAENMDVAEARHRERYDDIADQSCIFHPQHRAKLRRRPLEQFWRDHLLACSVLLDERSGFEHGSFVVLYPEENEIVKSAVAEYRSCLVNPATFASWTMEQVADALDAAAVGPWVRELRARYLVGT